MELALLCAAIYAASWLGGSLPTWWHWTHTRLQLVLSFVGGFILGVGLLHLLPHGIVLGQSLETAMPAALGGLLLMFFLMRIFHVHLHAPHDAAEAICHHGVPHAHGPHGPSSALEVPCMAQLSAKSTHSSVATDPYCYGGLDENVAVANQKTKRFGWIGLAVGLSLHMLLDGVVLAASCLAARHEQHAALMLGPFLAILLHEPLDVMSITTVMQSSGWSRRQVMLWSLLFAAMCPLGAALGHTGLVGTSSYPQGLLGTTLAFSAGMFLCIALSDILPELQFHAHDRWPLSLALLAGVILAFGLTWLEPAEWHQWPIPQGSDHSHAVEAMSNH